MKRDRHSPSSILRGVPYPVEPFGFKPEMLNLPPPLLQCEHNSFWQQPGLFGEVNERQENDLKAIHKVAFGLA